MEVLNRGKDEMMEDIFLQDDLHPTIAEHATKCNSLFHQYVVLPDIVPDPTIMDDQLARFTLWAANMDVYGPLNVSLDYRLRFSPTVVEIIHQLLGLICDTMVSLKPIGNPPPTPSRKRQRVSGHSDSEVWRRRPEDDASDSDSDGDPAEENISKITDIIGGTVTRLFRLSNAVRRSAKADRARRIERYRDDEQANQAIAELRLYTDCYIRFRFPMAPDSLRTALIEANAARLRRLYYQRTHRRRIGLSVQHPRTAPTVVQLPKIDGSAPTVRFDSSMLPKPATTKTMLGAASAPPVPITNATTARQSAVRALYAKSTTEVPRAKSVLVNNNLSFPPLPPTDECPYCGVIIEFKSRAKPMLWRNHVIRDLEPFICVSAQCLEAGCHGAGPATFETSGAWISHMQNAHGHTWECRAPSHNPITFDEAIHYQEHAIQEHGVPATHIGTLSLAARRPLLERILECPFGDDFQSPDKVEPNAVFSSEALQSHIAAHVKEIALLTLQKLPSDNEEDAENIDSDQPLEDDVPGFAKFRASMYSVMDDEALKYWDDDAVAADGSKDHGEEDITASVTRLDLQDKDGSRMAKLYHAVQAGDLILVQSLTHGGADLDSKDDDGRTVLHYASMEQSWGRDMMDLLLNAGDKATIDLGDNYGQTALHYAAERGLTDTISILVGHGADRDRTDNHGFSPCLWAAVAGQAQATNELLNIGADASAVSADGKSALHWAAGLGWSSVAEILLIHGASISQNANRHRAPLETAAASGDLRIVHMLLSSGGDPNHQDQDGWSAVHWAAEEGHLETVHCLLDRGADVDAVSSYGTSPLHCAANGGYANIVRLLLSRGANPLKSTCHGWTALHHAAYMGHSDVVQCLLEDDCMRSGASQQDNHGWSILHLAIHSRDLATIQVLLDSFAIAEPSALVDENGLTAEEWLDLEPTSYLYKATSNLAFSKSRCCRAVTGLRQAVLTGSVPLIRLLLRLGHDVNGMDSGRRTALYYAVKTSMFDIVDLLLEMGADPNILPMGRRSWKEFIADDRVLRRLNRTVHARPDSDPSVQRRILIALRAHGQPSAPRRSGPLLPNQSIVPSPSPPPSPMRERLLLSASAPSASSPLDHPMSTTPTRPPAPRAQTSDKKRKAKSDGSGLTRFFRRLLG